MYTDISSIALFPRVIAFLMCAIYYNRMRKSHDIYSMSSLLWPGQLMNESVIQSIGSLSRWMRVKVLVYDNLTLLAPLKCSYRSCYYSRQHCSLQNSSSRWLAKEMCSYMYAGCICGRNSGSDESSAVSECTTNLVE